MSIMIVKRGEIYMAALPNGMGCEQHGVRPVLILQNDIGNLYSPVTIVASITSALKRQELPVHYKLPQHIEFLPKDSIVLLEQIQTIDKRRLRQRMGKLPPSVMQEVELRLLISIGMLPPSAIHNKKRLILVPN
ncbi:UNVERIFIED_ORG: mRNA interferase MazF [Anoxybacillus amylolyticus]